MIHHIGDAQYEQAPGITLNMIQGSGWVEITADGVYGMMLVDRCQHCGRGDIVQKVAYSFEQAVQFGWLIPVED